VGMLSPDGTVTAPSGPVGPGGSGWERSQLNDADQGDPGRREGRGEGELVDQVLELAGEPRCPGQVLTRPVASLVLQRG